LVEDHQIDQAEAGASGAVGLEGGDRLLDPPRQVIGVAESAEVDGGPVSCDINRFDRLDERLSSVVSRTATFLARVESA
jgi:hypothetical protein